MYENYLSSCENDEKEYMQDTIEVLLYLIMKYKRTIIFQMEDGSTYKIQWSDLHNSPEIVEQDKRILLCYEEQQVREWLRHHQTWIEYSIEEKTLYH